MKHFFLAVGFFCMALTSLQAQYYLTGEDPASVKWNQLRTTYFRVIYPQANKEQAWELAMLLDTIYQASNFDLSSKTVRTDLILHSHSVISNALVAWAPRRADFYTTPPQDGYAQPWLKQLAVHELRHVSQINRLNQGFGKVLAYGFGQQISAGLLGAFVPLWFMEGDAVTNETSLSLSGRGRDGLFLAGLHAQLIQKGYYSLEKAYFGSYRDYTPDIYELGYYMVAHNKLKYGPALWENALRQTASKPYLLAPFSFGIRQQTGMGKNKLYQETIYSLYEKWSAADLQQDGTILEDLSPASDAYTSYRFPQIVWDGSIIAIRSAINDLTRIVKVKNGTTTKWITPGAVMPTSLSATDSLVAWTELIPDVRWTNQTYSVIKLADVRSGKIRELTKKSKFFAPALANDNSVLAATEQHPDGTSSLVILNVSSGEVLQKTQLNNYFLSTPKWHPNAQIIYVVATSDLGKAIFAFNRLDEKWTQLTPFSFINIQLSDVTTENAVVNASFSEVNQIYQVDLNSGKMTQLTSSRFGATDAVWDENNQTLVFSDYTADGYRLVKGIDRPEKQKPADLKNPGFFPLADSLGMMRLVLVDTIKTQTQTTFQEKRYRKAAHLFNLHSWSPLFIDADNINLKPGFSLFSQNSLSTMVATLGYTFDMNEQTGKSSVSLQYRGFYPIIEAGLSTGLRRNDAVVDNQLYHLKWNETEWYTAAYVPFNFTRDKWLRGIRPGVSVRQLIREMDPDVGLSFKQRQSTAFSYEFYAYRQLRLSKRDLYPKFGQNFQFLFRHSPFDADVSEQLFAAGTLYFPGLLKHHGIRLSFAYQQQTAGYYSFSSLITFPRGYTDLFYNETGVAKIDYAFPIFYPDMSVPGFLFLQRIRGAVFTDWLNGSGTHLQNQLGSAGVEIYTDWYFFNLPAPIILGGRVSRAFDNNEWVPEFLFGINISALY